jgi:cytoskeleton protein RodZ
LQASTELTLPSADVTALSSNAVTPPVATTVENPADASQPSSALPSTAQVPTVAPPAIQPSVIVPPETPIVATASGAAKLEFSANQETWVNVVDANGREIYSRTIFAGSRESVDVKPPVNVTVGNAGATSMSFNGKSVELAPHSRNNVAHIKLE